jgi:hypothetical protein
MAGGNEMEVKVATQKGVENSVKENVTWKVPKHGAFEFGKNAGWEGQQWLFCSE